MTIGKKAGLALAAVLIFAITLAYLFVIWESRPVRQVEAVVPADPRRHQFTARIRTLVADLQAAQRGYVMYSMLRNPEQVSASDRTWRSAAAEASDLLGQLRPVVITSSAVSDLDILHNGLAAWQVLYRDISAVCRRRRFDRRFQRQLKPFSEKLQRLQAEIRLAAEDLANAEPEPSRSPVQGRQEQDQPDWTFPFLLITGCLTFGVAMVWILRRIGGNILRAADDMDGGVTQITSDCAGIADSVQRLAQRSAEQATFLHEASGSIAELRSMARQNAASSVSATNLIADVERRVDGADRLLREVVASVKEMNDSSERVATIIRAIDEIAFHTNLIALNAAIEAARAGQSGMGFAVVAEEVRNLAQRCAQAAKDTAGLIQQSVSTTRDGKARLDQAAAAIQAITDSSASVRAVVEGCNRGSQEEVRRMEQLLSVLSQVERVSRTASQTAEESASASHEMATQAVNMKRSISHLRRMVVA